MTSYSDDRDDVEKRLDRLEATLEELRVAVEEDERIDTGRTTAMPGSETALRFTERFVVPAAVAALEVNVRTLEFLQDRLQELERRETAAGRPPRSQASERMLDRIDDALARMEEAITTADLPRDAESRRLLERARQLNADVRNQGHEPGARPTGTDVVRIDVEEELEGIREEVDAEADETSEAFRRDEDEE